MRRAVIDLGTNSALLLIVDTGEVATGALPFAVLHDEARVCRLGEGLHESSVLRESARKRVLEVLIDYKKTCDRLQVDSVILIGTEACRRATNCDTFAEEIKNATGWTLTVITPEQEAHFSYQAAYADFKGYFSQTPLVVDPGGGSTEFIYRTDQGKLAYTSLPIGSVVLTERYLLTDPPQEEEIKNLRAHVDDLFASHLSRFPKGLPLIALAGTATSLAAIDQSLAPYDGNRVQGYRLSLTHLRAITRRLCHASLEERKTIPGLHPDRASVMPGGALIIERILDFFKADECYISDRGVRYGILTTTNELKLV